MPTLVTTAARIDSALNFIANMGSTNNNYLYHFYGQQTAWASDTAPPIPDESVRTYKAIWDNMLGAQLITLNNLATVIPQNPWTANSIYKAYSDTDTDPYDTDNLSYIVNSNQEVFKCLANGGGNHSLVSPSGIGNASNNYIQTLSDGYAWKYMYIVQNGDQFWNTEWLPVYNVPLINSTQETIAQAAIPGSIDIINVIAGGNNYINSPQSWIVNIIGDGTGANAYANVSGSAVQNIVMVNRGQNYTYANVVFTDPSGSGATATVIMPPSGGHGANACFELGGTAVMASIFTYGDMQGFFTTTNSFRQSGIILNPYIYASNTVSTNTLVRTYTTLNLTGGVGTYSNNEIVYQGTSINNATFSGTIIDFDPVLGVLRVNNTQGAPRLSNILYGVSSGAQRFITNIINSDLQNYSGKLMLVENTAPIERANNQFEQFQYIIQF